MKVNRNLARYAAPAIANLPTGRVSQSAVNVPADFVSFASQCIIKSGSEFVPFYLYDYQILLGELLDKYPRHCWFKTRQLGASETIVCKMLQRSLLNPAYTGVTFSIGQKESSKLADRAAKMPQFRGLEWEYQSGQRIKAHGGGDLFFYPSTQNAARSLSSVTDELFDEAGFIPKFDSLYGSATPAQKMAGDKAGRYLVSTMPESGGLSPWWQIFLSDCPADIDIEEKMARVREGRGEYGAGVDYWIDNSGWCKVLLHWRSHPIYCLIPDYLDRVKSSEKLTEEKLRREYDLRMPDSSGSLFDLKAVERQAVGQWRSPISSHKYFIGIDPSFGGDDYYVALVFDITSYPYQLVHQFREHNRTNLYYKSQVTGLIEKYKPVLVAVESNSGGVVLIEQLQQQLPYQRIEKVSQSAVSKRLNTDRAAIAIEDGDIIYPPDWEFCAAHEVKVGDKVTRMPSEASQFLANTREGFTGHDDTVMALAVSLAWLDKALSMRGTRQTSPKVKEQDESKQLTQLRAKSFGSDKPPTKIFN